MTDVKPWLRQPLDQPSWQAHEARVLGMLFATPEALRLDPQLVVSDLGTRPAGGFSGRYVHELDVHCGYTEAERVLWGRGYLVRETFLDGEGLLVGRWSRTYTHEDLGMLRDQAIPPWEWPQGDPHAEALTPEERNPSMRAAAVAVSRAPCRTLLPALAGLSATREALNKLRALAYDLGKRGIVPLDDEGTTCPLPRPLPLTAARLHHVLDIVDDALNFGRVGTCAVCGCVAPLADDECPDCRH